MRTQVGIIGAGPAGLVLAHLLDQHGIESVVLESRSRAYVEQRVRAGVLEHGTVDLLVGAGVGDRLQREGLVHEGIELRFEGQRHRIPLTELTGRSIVVYGQQEVVKDLIAARLAADLPMLFEAEATAITDLPGRPTIHVQMDGQADTLECDFVAGCDGFWGISRAAIPSEALRVFETEYPFAWLGILARTPPASEELIYSFDEQLGFALLSMRSPQISRLYLQCAPDEHVEAWPDARIWNELRARLGPEAAASLEEGPILEKGVTAMRSFVVEPMQHGKLFLAGDAAHIVPPTGAKGMNLAIADVRVLADALSAWYDDGRADLLDSYSATVLRRVWRAEHFSWWMTSMLHRFPDESGFQVRLQHAQLRYVTSSRAAATSLAENYVGIDSMQPVEIGRLRS
jgi:p-hydroxybenzoate 3-monooxygenase